MVGSSKFTVKLRIMNLTTHKVSQWQKFTENCDTVVSNEHLHSKIERISFLFITQMCVKKMHGIHVHVSNTHLKDLFIVFIVHIRSKAVNVSTKVQHFKNN